jgi:hypothetical protein
LLPHPPTMEEAHAAERAQYPDHAATGSGGRPQNE